MLPILVIENGGYRPSRNAVLPSKIIYGVATLANLDYLIRHQFGVRPRYAGRSASPLAATILHVFKIRAQPKMTRVNARRIVAGVEAMQPLGNGAVAQLPRKTMCCDLLIGSAANANSAVAVLLRSASPYPALILASFDKVPSETLLYWDAFSE